jgi:fucose permease
MVIGAPVDKRGRHLCDNTASRHDTGIRSPVAPSRRSITLSSELARDTAQVRQRRTVLVALMFIGFISLGLPDGLLGVAWPSMARSRGVGIDALGTLLVASSAGYLTASVFSGRLLARLGVGLLLALSCLATALSLLGFASAPSWWLLLPIALVLGAGGGAIDAGLNTYAAATSSPRVLTWLHAFFGVGATAGPAIMTSLLSLGQPWQLGYLLVGCAQLALAACFVLTRRRWEASEHHAIDMHGSEGGTSLRRTLALPAVWLSAAVFAVYTGFEVTVGQWSYSLFTVGRGVDPTVAGTWISLYWFGLTAGRFLVGLIADRVRPATLLWAGALGALSGALLVGMVPFGWASVTGLVLCGFSLAPIFPALIATTADRVGRSFAANTIGIQVACAGAGAALIPWVIGRGVAFGGPAVIAPAIVIAAALYFILFALASRTGRREESSEPASSR